MICFDSSRLPSSFPSFSSLSLSHDQDTYTLTHSFSLLESLFPPCSASSVITGFHRITLSSLSSPSLSISPERKGQQQQNKKKRMGITNLLSVTLFISVLLSSGSQSLSSVSAVPVGSASLEDRDSESVMRSMDEESGRGQQDQRSNDGDGNAMGALTVHVRSLPPSLGALHPPPTLPSVLSPSSRTSSLFPFLSQHLLALRHLINASAAQSQSPPSSTSTSESQSEGSLLLPQDVRDRILKYYFLSDLPNAGQQNQQQSQASSMGRIGTLNHSPPPSPMSQSLMSGPSSSPLRESELRRLLTRFTGHPIETLLRRALRASRSGQYCLLSTHSLHHMFMFLLTNRLCDPTSRHQQR